MKSFAVIFILVIIMFALIGGAVVSFAAKNSALFIIGVAVVLWLGYEYLRNKVNNDE